VSNKNDLYNARHRLPTDGSVRGNDGRVWHPKGEGKWWYTDERYVAAIPTSVLSQMHGPLIKVEEPKPTRELPVKAMPRG